MLAKLTKGFERKDAPSGAFSRLVRKSDGKTVAWAVPVPKKGGVRLDFIVRVAEAPKQLLTGTWIGSGKRHQLLVSDANLAQALALLAWAKDQAPAKTSVAKGAAPARRRRPAAKRRVHFRLANGDVRTERVPEDEVEEFARSLEKQGAEVLSGKS